MRQYKCSKRKINKIITVRECWACWHGMKQQGVQFSETRFKCVEENAVIVKTKKEV